MSAIPRRSLLKAAAVAGAAAQFSWVLGRGDAQAAAPAETPAADRPSTVTWLEPDGLGAAAGSTFGAAWPQGVHPGDQAFALTTADGANVPVQTWTTARWPDGSLKWTAHAVGREAAGAERFTLAPGAPATAATTVSVTETDRRITVDTGTVRAVIRKDGGKLVESVTRDGVKIATDGRLRPAPAERPRRRRPGQRQVGAVRRRDLRRHRRTARPRPGRGPHRRQAPQGQPQLAAVLRAPLLLRGLRVVPHGPHHHLRR